MNGPTAQIAALTCHLHARNRRNATRRFFPDNSTCQFCEFVHFLRPNPGSSDPNHQWEIVATTPDDWLNGTMCRAPYRAVLIHQAVNDSIVPDRMTAGLVGGGGRWLIRIERDGRSEYWKAFWQIGDREAKDKRIWRVRYLLVAEGRNTGHDTVSVVELTGQVADALKAIETFARNKNIDHFADRFALAQRCLTADDPFAAVYHRDLAPAGSLTLEAARLLAACQAASVFGAMGSWNDLMFDGDEQLTYEQLSAGLYGLLNAAICASVNESAACTE